MSKAQRTQSVDQSIFIWPALFRGVNGLDLIDMHGIEHLLFTGFFIQFNSVEITCFGIVFKHNRIIVFGRNTLDKSIFSCNKDCSFSK